MDKATGDADSYFYYNSNDLVLILNYVNIISTKLQASLY